MATQNPYSDMMKFWSDYKAPQMGSFDMSNAMSYGRKNAEAATAAGQTIAEGLQTIARRQVELARAQVEQALKTTKDSLVGGSPEINTAKQADLAKRLFETSLGNLREVTELATKSGLEAYDVWIKRATEQMEELTSFGKSATNGAARPSKKAN